MTALSATPSVQAEARRVCGEPIRRLLGLCLIFAALSAGMVVMAVHHTRSISISDEATHADYAYEISHGHIPAAGSIIAPEILKEWACDGLWPGLDPKQTIKCGVNNAATLFPPTGPQGGSQYNFGHPPLYYAITGVVTRLLTPLDPGSNFIAIARLTGIGWMLAAMIVTYLAARRFGARWPFAFAAGAILPFIPTLLNSVSIVTNDAAGALAGAIAALVLARICVDHRLGWILPTVCAFLITATKVLNALPILAVAVVVTLMALKAWRDNDRDRFWHLAKIVIGIGLAFAIVYFGWQAFQSGRGVKDWINPIRKVTGRPIKGDPLDELLSTSMSGFGLGLSGSALTVITPGYNLVTQQVAHEWLLLWTQASSWLLISAPFAVLASARRFSPAWKAGALGLGVIVAYPLVVEIQIYVSSNLYFPVVTARYGLTIMPVCLIAASLVASRRNAWRSTTVVGLLGALAMIVTLGSTGW
jgi:hypothetical protein